MKNKIYLIAILTILISLTLCSCSGETILYTKNYDMNIGVKACPEKEITFNIASYNIQGGKLTIDKATEIRKMLTANDTAIAGLQEMDHLSLRTNKADFLKVFSQETFEHTFFAPTHTALMKDTYGIATIAASEFDVNKSFLLPYPYNRENQNIEKRMVTRTLITIDEVQIAFYNTHLSYENISMQKGKTLRDAQIDFIISLLDSDPVQFKILCGDFNVNAFKEYDSFLNAGYKAVNNAQNVYPTFRGNSSFKSIDNIIYSANLFLTDSKMLDSELSDHNPLFASFKTSYN